MPFIHGAVGFVFSEFIGCGQEFFEGKAGVDAIFLEGDLLVSGIEGDGSGGCSGGAGFPAEGVDDDGIDGASHGGGCGLSIGVDGIDEGSDVVSIIDEVGPVVGGEGRETAFMADVEEGCIAVTDGALTHIRGFDLRLLEFVSFEVIFD